MDQEVVYRQLLSTFLLGHAWFRSILETVRSLNPPDWLVGAGVIRSLVWDHLHGYTTPTRLVDVDVVFFDPTDLRPDYDAESDSRITPYTLRPMSEVPLLRCEGCGHEFLWADNVKPNPHTGEKTIRCPRCGYQAGVISEK